VIKRGIFHGSHRKSYTDKTMLPHLLVGNGVSVCSPNTSQGLGEYFEVRHIKWKETARLSIIKFCASLNTGYDGKCCKKTDKIIPFEGSVKKEYDCALRQRRFHG